ncbi:MAG: hypothetical protein JXB50_00480 [Spirochaetes bacterium]|nr:hypothetical protein [Spirochaetota bacterium]
MPLVQLPGDEGLVWQPEKTQNKKKNCKDCFACQFCSDSRCNLCLKNKKVKNYKKI